jgi:protein SCO1/2
VSRGQSVARMLLGVALVAAAMGPVRAGETEAGATVRSTTVRYETPDVKLVRADGRSVSLRHELDDGRPVFMNFVFTTCATICPMSSAIFEQLQAKLGADHDHVHLVSVSIDPEQDTPAHLTEYAARFHALPGWQHYTGTLEASIAVQRAFNVYRGDKMNHAAVTLVRMAPGEPWTRLDGFADAGLLYQEYRQFVAKR